LHVLSVWFYGSCTFLDPSLLGLLAIRNDPAFWSVLCHTPES